MTFVINPEPQSLKEAHFIIRDAFSPQFLDSSKTRSPGSFPEGEVGFPGRITGRFFALVTLSSPEKTLKRFPHFPEGKRKGIRKGKVKKSYFGSSGPVDQTLLRKHTHNQEEVH